jgi:hypothetical protein
MAYSEVSSESWGSRLLSSVVGVLVGIVLFLVAFPILFWNEGRAVKTAQGLEEGAANVVSIADPGKVDAGADGKLVHMSGKAETKETLKDDQFGVAVPAIRLSRNVEMYQYKEVKEEKKKKKIGGGEETVTTYTYPKEWSSKWLDSSGYKDPDHPNNPPSMPYKGESWRAKEVSLGAYKLSDALAGQIKGDDTLTVSANMLEAVPTDLRDKLQVKDGYFYQAANPDKKDAAGPEIGDVRIQYQQIKNGPEVSLVAQQAKDSFVPYVTKTNTTIDDLRMGMLSKDGMFQQLQAENTTLTWILRGVGFFLMVIGIALFFKPLSVMADFLPILGNIVSAGFFIVAIGLAIPLTLITIAIGWVAYRPMVGIPLLVVAVLALVGLFMIGSKRKAAKAAA